MWSRLDLGVGLIALGGIDRIWEGVAELVDVIEVEPQTLWTEGSGRDRRIAREALAWLRERDRPLLAHGVGFPVGGTCSPPAEAVAASARSAQELDAVHWSEHLAFNRVGDQFAGFLLPPIQTRAGVEAAVRHIGRYQAASDRPFLIETPTNYLRTSPGDLRDGEYVGLIAERADCGILLDLHNIWANARNGRQPVTAYLKDLPLERVWEVHLAGGFETGGYYLDAHVGPVDPELLELAGDIVPRLPNVRALIYEAIPASLSGQGIEGIRTVLMRLHDLASMAAKPDPSPASPVCRRSAPLPRDEAGATARREAELLAWTTRVSPVCPDGDPGADVLRSLTDQARLSLVARAAGAELTTLIRRHGRGQAEQVLRQFLAETSAMQFDDEAAASFSVWLSGHH